MPYSALICDDGLPFPLRLHDLPLELLLVMTGTIRIGHDDQLLRCHVPHEPVQYIVANPVASRFTTVDKPDDSSTILTDDKAPVEVLGMHAIDQIIAEEAVPYRQILKDEGIGGLLRAVQ